MVHLYGRFLRKTSNSKPAVSKVSQLRFLRVQPILVPAFLDKKTSVHVETGHDMIEPDQSSLGGCQGQYWLTEIEGRTVVIQNASRISPVDHGVNTHVQRRWRSH